MKSRDIGETAFVCIAMMGLPVAIVGALWWHGWLLAAPAVGDLEVKPKRDERSPIKNTDEAAEMLLSKMKPLPIAAEDGEPEAKRAKLRAVK